MKLGTYKEDDWNVTYYENGEVWSVMPNSFMTEEQFQEWDKLPNGHKFPEPTWEGVLEHVSFEILDFGQSPPRILTQQEIKELYNE